MIRGVEAGRQEAFAEFTRMLAHLLFWGISPLVPRWQTFTPKFCNSVRLICL